MSAIEIVMTGPSTEMKKCVSTLLAEKLIACGQFWSIESIYWWKEQIESGSEVRVAMHTRGELSDMVFRRIRQRHSYDVACILSIPLLDVDPDYLEWIRQSTAQSPEALPGS